MAITRDTSRGQLVPLTFGQDAVAASQTDVQLPVVIGEASQAVGGYTAPWGGEVVGLSFALDAAGSAGTMTLGASIDGTEDADTTLTVTTSAGTYKRIPRGKCTFIAGQAIGVELTTDGTWNGTSSDLVVQLWVLFYLEGI